jgi:hypothetical protein
MDDLSYQNIESNKSYYNRFAKKPILAFGRRLDRLQKCHRRSAKFPAVAQDKSFGRHGAGLLKYDPCIGCNPALSQSAAQGLMPKGFAIWGV